jgi:hypothetical protein
VIGGIRGHGKANLFLTTIWKYVYKRALAYSIEKITRHSRYFELNTVKRGISGLANIIKEDKTLIRFFGRPGSKMLGAITVYTFKIMCILIILRCSLPLFSIQPGKTNKILYLSLYFGFDFVDPRPTISVKLNLLQRV